MSCVCYAFKLRIFLSDLSAYRRLEPGHAPRQPGFFHPIHKLSLSSWAGLKFLNVYGLGKRFSLNFLG